MEEPRDGRIVRGTMRISICQSNILDENKTLKKIYPHLGGTITTEGEDSNLIYNNIIILIACLHKNGEEEVTSRTSRIGKVFDISEKSVVG